MPLCGVEAEPLRFDLDNGLRVVVQPRGKLPLVAVNLWYHVGSKNERSGRTGLAHLFEHMLFQGSEHVDTNGHFAHLQQVGGVANGSTWFDRTNYYETLPAHQLELALWLESDRMGFLLPALTQEKLDNQRQVVLNERLQRVDNQPYGRSFETLQELLYPDGHPYGWPVLGYPEDLRATSLEDLREFFKVHYAPGNAVLSVVGDVEPGRVRDLVEGYFGDLPEGPEAPAVERPPGRPPGRRRESQEDDVPLARIYLGCRGPSYGTSRWYAGALLASALGGGKTSPLYRDLVYERRMAQDVACFLLPTELDGAFMVVATATPGTSPDALEREIEAHLDRAAADKIPEGDLERARRGALTGHFEAMQSLESHADLVSQGVTYFDDPLRPETEPDRYRDVGLRDLQEFASRHLDRGDRILLRVLPDESARTGE